MSKVTTKKNKLQEIREAYARQQVIMSRADYA